jgi:arylsulfatase A-like enzyme
MKAVIIVANGWNAGWLGCFGNEWQSTPHADQLAAESVLFDQHFAINPAPEAWRRSLASGCFELTLADDARPSLFAHLRTAGVYTVRLVDGRRPETNQASADWDDSIALVRSDDAPPGEALLQALSEQLRKHVSRDNWLLWIETDRLLPPWSVSLDYFDRYADGIGPDGAGQAAQPWDEPPSGKCTLTDRDHERLYGTYASVVTEWDADLGCCIDLLRRHQLDESALWAVTSGHGLALGEHNWIGTTGERLDEELVHVPLLLRLPKAEQGGRRVALQTAAVDLLPTLLDMFALARPAHVHGRSLLGPARGDAAPLRSCLGQALGASRGLRAPEWALLANSGSPSLLFRKPEDRWEMNDQRMQYLEWAEYLEQTLLEFIRTARQAQFEPPVLKTFADVVGDAIPRGGDGGRSPRAS